MIRYITLRAARICRGSQSSCLWRKRFVRAIPLASTASERHGRNKRASTPWKSPKRTSVSLHPQSVSSKWRVIYLPRTWERLIEHERTQIPKRIPTDIPEH